MGIHEAKAFDGMSEITVREVVAILVVVLVEYAKRALK
jgi:hypothetical protein